MLDEFLRPHFRRREFACKGGDNCCGGAAPVDDRLVTGLQILRSIVNRPITITSGFRCVKHNASIGGSERSQHTLGKAADIRCAGFTSEELAEAAERVDEFRDGGIGIYQSFVHVDVRTDGQARWRG